MPASYINTGPLTSPGIFSGGCPSPLTLAGSWGPGKLYAWQDYVKTGNTTTAIATNKNVIGLPNGIAMIHWNKNNLSSALNNNYSVEMITGWGSYPTKVVANDYGWVNGTIMNMLGKFQIHSSIFTTETSPTPTNMALSMAPYTFESCFLMIQIPIRQS